MIEHLFVSPHLDDAAYSAGGTIARLAGAGKSVAVLTVFAGEPPKELSPFAQSLHDRWEIGDRQQTRTDEDIASLSILKVDAIQLDFLDCIYRTDVSGSLYDNEESLTGRMHDSDNELVEQISDIIAGIPQVTTGTKIYGPAGVGNHVDHQVVHRSLRRLDRYDRLYYSDYPHVETSNFDSSNFEAVLLEVSEADLKIKIEAMAAHASQLSSFWDSKEDLASKVTKYWNKNNKSEVFWR